MAHPIVPGYSILPHLIPPDSVHRWHNPEIKHRSLVVNGNYFNKIQVALNHNIRCSDKANTQNG